MKMSTRARYGARALAELAAAYHHKPLSVKELAHIQCLSVKYLEQIMAALKAAGLVRAVRGLHGGYELGSAPEEISLGDVYEALEGKPMLVECIAHPETCAMRENCPTRDTWVELNEAVTQVLEKTTLADLARRKVEKSRQAVGMYEI